MVPPLAWMALARKLDVSIVAEDPLRAAMLFLGLLPSFLLVFWANRRAFGGFIAPYVKEPSAWKAAAAMLGGVAAILGVGVGIVYAVGIEDRRSGQLVIAYVIGLAFSAPFALYHLWITRRWWLHPGSYWGPTEKERREALRTKAEEERRKADERRREARAASESAKRERQDRRRRVVGRRDDG